MRRRFQQEQKHREHIEAQIAELEKLPGGVSDAQLEKLGLLPWSPAVEFLVKRLDGVSLDELDSKFKQALIDLIASDVPLDQKTRSLIAAELRRLYFPDAKRDRHAKRQSEIKVIENRKRQLLDRGMTMKEAEDLIVKEMGRLLGIATVAALRQKIYRTKH